MSEPVAYRVPYSTYALWLCLRCAGRPEYDWEPVTQIGPSLPVYCDKCRVQIRRNER